MCTNSLAIHLELVESYSSDSLLTSLARTFARRNLPKNICTDTRTNFIKSRQLLLSQGPGTGFTEMDLDVLSQKWPQLEWKVLPAGAHYRLGAG